MNKAASAGVAVILLILVGCQVRNCRQAGAVMAPPRGVEHVYQCLTDKSEYKLGPEQIQAAILKNEVGRSPAGESLYRCPKCGKLSLQLVTRGAEATP